MKKRFFASLAGAFALGLLGLSSQAEAQPLPLPEAPESVQVVGFTHGGSGCPAGSVGSQLTPDRRTLSLLFDAFVSHAAPSLAPTESRKSCDLAIVLNFPPGWSFSVVTADYRGAAELQARVVGTQLSSYFFAGTFGPSFATRITGPYSGNYARRDTLGLESAVWSPCGRDATLRIHTESRVSTLLNQGGSGLMTVDSTDLVVQQTYGLVWRRCS